MTPHFTAMHTRADMERLRRRTRYALSVICIIGITFFTGYLIGQGITEANYDRLHAEEMLQ